jgi:branched-chain amino acid transport system ATP-binding protein
MLTLRGLTKQIGGLRAVNSVDLSLKENEIVGLVGPNGAGKTTLLNMISGISSPTAGTITFRSEDITGLKADRICKKGITKTFQIAESFPGLTARECTMIGALFGNHRKISMADAGEEATQILDFVGFPPEKRETTIRNLNVVELKRVQLARALASKPKLLLLDELTTGLNPKESNEAVGLIRNIRDRGISILIIEHVMSVIMGVSDRIVVLDHGEKIADGRPYEVVNNPRVIDTYLGDIDAF